jgi:hypothetical protein
MMQGFRVAGASVPGTDHIMPGEPGWKNNQDSYAWFRTDNAFVAIVCDGCGSMPQSDVGAQLLATYMARTAVRGVDFGLTPETTLDYLAEHATDFITSIVSMMGGNKVADASRYFLFTTLGVLVTPERTLVFSIGDGVYAVNGEVTVIEQYKNNAPPYIGYRVTGGTGTMDLRFQVRADIPTAEVSSILIGTDGVADLMKVAELPLPGTEEPVGPLSQFWTNEKFFKNADEVRRRLARINRETAVLVNERPRIQRGLLRDDTTIVVLTQERKSQWPISF